MAATQYESLTQCRLDNDYLKRLAGEDIAAFEAGLIQAFSRWPSFREPVQEAMFDMAFNLGIGGLRKFVKLLAAVEAGKWETATLDPTARAFPKPAIRKPPRYSAKPSTPSRAFDNTQH
jgi:hypothetical protein